MKRRILSLVLCFCMALSLLPMGAFAADGKAAGYQSKTDANEDTHTYSSFEAFANDFGALSYNSETNTFSLTQDWNLTSRINIFADVIIDLGGHTITTSATCPNGSAFDIRGGDVTIKNGTIDGTGVVQASGTGDTNECDPITVRSGATAVLEGLNITIDSITGACAYAFDGGKITINSGKYFNNTVEQYPYRTSWKAMALNQENVDTQLVFVNGGQFKAINPAAGDDSGKVASFLSEGYTSYELGEGTFTYMVEPSAGYPINYYNVDEATYAEGVTPLASYTHENLPYTLPEPTKAGFTFDGWYSKADFSGGSTTYIPVGTNWTVNLYAKWTTSETELVTYTVSFDANTGNPQDNPAELSVESGQTATKPDDPIYTGNLNFPHQKAT